MTDISPAERAQGRETLRPLESTQESPAFLSVPSALVIAHPGHELRVHGWMCRAQPSTFILTDGSGRSGKARIEPTSKILREAGATPGSLYGRLTDRDAYQLVLNRQFDALMSSSANWQRHGAILSWLMKSALLSTNLGRTGSAMSHCVRSVQSGQSHGYRPNNLSTNPLARAGSRLVIIST